MSESQRLNLKPVIELILAEYALPVHGLHGIAHWARVLENGLRLATATGANVEIIQLSDKDFKLFYRACAGHTQERTHPNITIQTCWDADRLDLGRLGVMPHPSRLCTDAAKQKEMIQWADGRASFQVVPEFVAAEWGIEIE